MCVFGPCFRPIVSFSPPDHEHPMITNAHSLTHPQLRELSRELAVELARVQRRLALADDVAQDEADAEHAEQQAKLAAQRDRLSAALGRVSDGQYGYCIACGGAIAYGRLLLHPDADLCLSCAQVPTTVAAEL